MNQCDQRGERKREDAVIGRHPRFNEDHLSGWSTARPISLAGGEREREREREKEREREGRERLLNLVTLKYTKKYDTIYIYTHIHIYIHQSLMSLSMKYRDWMK
jgi:hypothetical protein